MATPNIGNVPQHGVHQTAAVQGEIQAQAAEKANNEADMRSLVIGGFVKNTVEQRKPLKEQKDKDQKIKRKGETEGLEDDEAKILAIELAEEEARRFNQENPEMERSVLMALFNGLKAGQTKDDIIKMVRSFYKDHFLADEALGFLIATTTGSLKEEVQKARDEIMQQHGKEIAAGRNIAVASREFAEKSTLGSPKELRSIYYQVIDQPDTALNTFKKMTAKFPYEKMEEAIKFLYHSLGEDLKVRYNSKDDAPLLQKLIDDIQNLQAISWVFLYFKENMKAINNAFDRARIEMPKSLTFQSLAHAYASLLELRINAINSNIVSGMAPKLGIMGNPEAQIIVFTVMRNATRQTSMELYKDENFRNRIQEAINNAISKLDEIIEEEG